MVRTRLGQIEQIQSSYSYDDKLNMGPAAEGQPDDTIGVATATIVNFSTAHTVIVSGDYVSAGANINDEVVISGSTGNDGTFEISGLSYNSTLDQTDFTVVETLIIEAGSGTATIKVDPVKNLSRDLDFIRTQLRKLNQTAHWYTNPLLAPINEYDLITGVTVSTGVDIVIGGGLTFDAGEPYTLKVFFNGQLLLPSEVSGGIVVLSGDYEEHDATGLVEAGETGDRIRFNFDVENTDLIQLKWTKK